MRAKLNKAHHKQILAVVVALVFLLSFEFLPQKHITLVPAPLEQMALYADSKENGNSTIHWVEPGKYWECDFRKDGPIFYCGMTVSFQWDTIQGKDLSGFQEMHLEIEASAGVKELTVSMRNFGQEYATPDMVDTYMYNFVALPASDLNKQIQINLEEFRVAEWWIERFNVPRRFQRPQFDNVVSIGFDISWRNPEGKQLVYVKKCTFVGDIVSRATWYLMAILFGLTAILYQAITAAVIARKKSQKDRAIIEKMAAVQRDLMYQNAEIEKRSTIDPLTQVYNRLGFENMLETLREGELADVQSVMIVMDIDHFKEVNDVYGHATGDKAIAQMAKILRKNLREFDSVVRWGGEEFLLLLPNCTLENGAKTAEKMRIAIEQTTIEHEPPFNITASFGVTSFKASENFGRAFDLTDKALYMAKRGGRNRVVVFNHPDQSPD